MLRRNPLAYSISCVLAAGALGTGNLALAQDQDAQDQAEAMVVEEVLVTGSRIKRDTFNNSTPIDVVTTENAGMQGIADVGTLLQSSTIAAGSSQVNAATSTAFVTNGGLGTQTLSLRGLGANRTLFLLNGRRVGPAGTRGSVSAFDLNVIPLAAIERVEILKDGASSIYGSDAVAGVVNIITRKDDGGTAEAYIGIPEDGGGEETRLSASWGTSSERSRFRVTLDYHKQYELTFGDRRRTACPNRYIFDPDTGERADPIDPRTNEYHCIDDDGGIWGHVWIYDYQGEGGNVPFSPGGREAKAQFDYDGDLGQYIPGFEELGTTPPDDPLRMKTPPGWFPVAYSKETDAVTNWDHPFQDDKSFIPETEKITFFAEGEYNLNDNTMMYAEVLLNRRKTFQNSYRQFWSYIYNYDYQYSNPLSAGWTGAQWLSPTAITDHNDQEVEIEYQRFVAGLTGDIGETSWFWDLSFQYSKSDGDYTEDKIYGDSIYDQNWLGGSCEDMTLSVRGIPCQDIPWLDPFFLAGDISPAMRDFLFTTQTGNTEYTQWSAEGYASGEVWEGWGAGSINGAFGFHYREDEINDTPQEITRQGNAWGDSVAGITAGSDSTTALFGELDIPIIANKTGFELLTLNASARWTDVDSYGDDTTYKVGINWQITPSWRFRANTGTSFRTPALFELYLADETSFISQRFLDPCIQWGGNLDEGLISQRVADNCAATVTEDYPDGLPPDYTGGSITGTVVSKGGLGRLEAETSDSSTIGIVWQPDFANLSVSVDYFDIEVNDQVDQLGTSIPAGCYASEFFPDDPLCGLFDRSGINSGIENVQDDFINVATQTNKGWDVALQWITDLWGGQFKLDTQHTFQTEAITALFEGFERDENGQFGEPEWVGRFWLTWDKDDWSFFWGIDMIGDVSNHESYGDGEYKDDALYRGETVRVVLSADEVFYHTFSATKYFGNDQEWRAVLGVRNAFDEDPPRVTTLDLGELNTDGGVPIYSQYDYLGRTWYASLAWNF
jgi:iron complex outermembrane receptor protein